MLLSKVYSTNIKLSHPYNFYLTASFYSTRFEFDGTYAYVILNYDEDYAVSRARSEDKLILIDIYATKSSSDLIERALRDTAFIMGFNEDLREFYSLCANDPLLGILSKELYGIHMRAVQGLWEGLLISICQQNASFRQGWRMLMRIREILGEELRIPDSELIFYTFPSPKKIIEKPSLLRQCGVGYRDKIFLNAAKAFIRNNEPELIEIKGIGQYSARLAKILGKRDYREFPVDRWFSTLIPRVYAREEKWSIKEVEEFARKRWGKYAGLAAIMITVVTGAKPISSLLKVLEKGQNPDPFPHEPAPLTLWRYSL